MNPEEQLSFKGILIQDQIKSLCWMSDILRQAANLSKVDNHVTCLGLLLFQRFAKKNGFLNVDFRATSIACLYLGAKICDKHVRLSKLLIMYFMAFQLKIVSKKRNLNLMKNSKLYAELKARVLGAEMEVLQSMGFELYSFIKTAHIYLMYLYKSLKFSRQLFELAWTCLNDVYSSFLVTVLPPQILAVAAVMLGYRKLKEEMPAISWWLLYEVKEEDIQIVIKAILRFYREKEGDWDLKKLKIVFEKKNWQLKEDMGTEGNLAIRKNQKESKNEENDSSKENEKTKKKKKNKNKKDSKKNKKDNKEKKEKKKNKKDKKVKKHKKHRDKSKYREHRRDRSRDRNLNKRSKNQFENNRYERNEKDNKYNYRNDKR